ncbi:hypothetical protein [Fimbriiglobus ruber]|uniref:Uncharacterized protein n=1 Tax=Fimbriiglobus ruber TaxID=1908690 RepID=A0A225DD33_9BACT|nr:hypothetical protein [Fimbriiglobus ruber]OWK34315.1 hypothetical protein FRUB_10286 [Fimbriiglobus ruber]
MTDQKLTKSILRKTFGEGTLSERKRVTELLVTAGVSADVLATVTMPGAGMLIRKAATHAPKGGVTVGGKDYVGGQFIPSEVLDKATPEEKAKIAQGHANDATGKTKGNGDDDSVKARKVEQDRRLDEAAAREPVDESREQPYSPDDHDAEEYDRAREFRERGRGDHPSGHRALKRVVGDQTQETGQVATSGASPEKPAGKQSKPRTVTETVALVHKLKADQGLTTPETVRALADAFTGHTHAELAEIKKQLGVKASGTKAEVSRKLAERIAAPTRSNLRHYSHERMTADEAHEHVKGLATRLATDPEAVRELAHTLTTRVSAKDLHEVKRRLGLRASGGKAEVARKLAARAVLAHVGAKAQAAPVPKEIEAKGAAQPEAPASASPPATPPEPPPTPAAEAPTPAAAPPPGEPAPATPTDTFGDWQKADREHGRESSRINDQAFAEGRKPTKAETARIKALKAKAEAAFAAHESEQAKQEEAAPSPESAPTKAGRVAAMPTAEFAAAVNQAAKDFPHGFGNKVFISDMYDHFHKEDPSLTPEVFKKKLVESIGGRGQGVELSRADLPQLHHPDFVDRSEIRHGNTHFHLINVPETGGYHERQNKDHTGRRAEDHQREQAAKRAAATGEGVSAPKGEPVTQAQPKSATPEAKPPAAPKPEAAKPSAGLPSGSVPAGAEQVHVDPKEGSYLFKHGRDYHTPINPDVGHRKQLAAKHAAAIKDAYETQHMFEEHRSGMIPLHRIISQVRQDAEANGQTVPSVNDVQNAMYQLNKDRHLELHKLSEVHMAKDHDLKRGAIHEDGRMYNFMMPSQGKDLAAYKG